MKNYMFSIASALVLLTGVLGMFSVIDMPVLGQIACLPIGGILASAQILIHSNKREDIVQCYGIMVVAGVLLILLMMA